MDPEECIYSYNILSEDFGMEVRDGYHEWANGWTGGPARTVITFEGNVDTEDQLWVANDTGIWNVTPEGETAPAQELVWPSTLGNVGICSYVNFTNDGNDRFILLCDGENGYYVWTQTTGLWTQGSFSGGSIDVELLDYVMIWKQRVWFVEKNSANAWYLPVNSFSGVATAFNFGAQFRFGGSLISMHNWTLDGGVGIDDYLVAISGAGDVAIFQGTDPAETDFGVVGSWYVGELPAGNRVGTEFSGELYILSVQGLLPLSRLLNGASASDSKTYLTNKVSPYIRPVMDSTLRDFGWHIHVHPKQSLLFVNSPPRGSQDQLAFTLYLGNMAWSMIRGLTKGHTANWQGEVYWSDINVNKLFIQRGNVDKVYIDPETDGEPESIDWSTLSSYLQFENQSLYKRVQYIRPMFVAGSPPSFNVQAVYDYNIAEVISAASPTQTDTGVWGTSTWGGADWAGSAAAADNPRGANGMGRHIAISLRGRSSSAVTFVGHDIAVDQGGMM